MIASRSAHGFSRPREPSQATRRGSMRDGIDGLEVGAGSGALAA